MNTRGKSLVANKRNYIKPSPSSPAARVIMQDRPRIVVIGGGSGTSQVLQGLKHHPVDITAIVTMFDSGGSSGLLREEFGYPPFGDLRQCLVALSNEDTPSATLKPLLDFRFCEDSSLQGHNVGNLVLAALTSLFDVEEAVNRLSQILRIRGRVVPVSFDKAELFAEMDNGSILKGETSIDLRGCSSPRISRVFLEPAAAANPSAVQAILEADAVVIGPGDLYTSIIPNLLVQGIPEALCSTSAILIYVCNLMTKRGETDDFTASDFVSEINRYLNGTAIRWALVNTAPMEQTALNDYVREGAQPVVADLDQLSAHGVKHVWGPLAGSSVPVRHDAMMLANVIMGLLSPYAMPEMGLIPSASMSRLFM